MTLAPTWWEALTKKIPGENENFMHVGDSHHKLTIHAYPKPLTFAMFAKLAIKTLTDQE